MTDELLNDERAREWVQRALDIATGALRDTINIEIVEAYGNIPIQDEQLTDHIYEVATRAVIDAWLAANIERSLSSKTEVHGRGDYGFTYPPDAARQLKEELERLIDNWNRPEVSVTIEPS